MKIRIGRLCAPFRRPVVILWIAALGACHTIESRVEIDAPGHQVWEQLSDFQAYGEWNSFIRRLDVPAESAGGVGVGRGIEVEIHPPGGDSMVFRPVITDLETGKILEWEGQLLLPGLFTGRHRFELVELESGGTLLKQSEKFRGVLVPFFNFDNTEQGFKAMNRELKERAENPPAGNSD